MEIRQPEAVHDFDGVLSGAPVVKAQKFLGQIMSIYRNAEHTDPDTLMYDVYTIARPEDELNWGLTVLYPVLVNGECNMTRGHFHENEQRDEIYVGQSGRGLLMRMDETGKTWCEQVFRGSFHYIQGTAAHRLINTGSEPLKVMACWPQDAGHDYARTEKMPFGSRVFLVNGEVQVEDHE